MNESYETSLPLHHGSPPSLPRPGPEAPAVHLRVLRNHEDHCGGCHPWCRRGELGDAALLGSAVEEVQGSLPECPSSITCFHPRRADPSPPSIPIQTRSRPGIVFRACLILAQGGVLSARTLRAATPTFSAAVKGKSGGVADVSAAAATAAKSGYWAGSEWVPASAKLSADWKTGKQTVRASTSGRGAGVGGAAMGYWVLSLLR